MNKEQELTYNELVSKFNFDEEQKKEIKSGLDRGIDVSIYAKPEFNFKQMKTIKNGLIDNTDSSWYAKP